MTAIDPQARYAVQPAWCADDAESLERTRRLTHDLLLEKVGDRPHGGVTWLTFKGDAAIEVLAHLREDNAAATQEDLDAYRRLAACLREYGGCLVLATVDG